MFSLCRLLIPINIIYNKRRRNVYDVNINFYGRTSNRLFFLFECIARIAIINFLTNVKTDIIFDLCIFTVHFNEHKAQSAAWNKQKKKSICFYHWNVLFVDDILSVHTTENFICIFFNCLQQTSLSYLLRFISIFELIFRQHRNKYCVYPLILYSTFLIVFGMSLIK